MMLKPFAGEWKCWLESPQDWTKGLEWGQRGRRETSHALAPQTSMSSPAAPARGGAELQNICPECFSFRDFPPPPHSPLAGAGGGLMSLNKQKIWGEWNTSYHKRLLPFLVIWKAAASPSVQLLFRWSLGWDELVGRRVDACLLREWWLSFEEPLAFTCARDCSLFDLSSVSTTASENSQRIALQAIFW